MVAVDTESASTHAFDRRRNCFCGFSRFTSPAGTDCTEDRSGACRDVSAPGAALSSPAQFRSCSRCAVDRKRGNMEPNLVYRAEHQVHHHEFVLAVMAIKAVHRLHRSTTRTEDTLREVLTIVANGEPVESPPVRTEPNPSEAEPSLSRKRSTRAGSSSGHALQKAA